MTQLQQARAGVITPEMSRVAQRERQSPETIRDELAAGRLVIPANRVHLAGVGGGVRLDPCGIRHVDVQAQSSAAERTHFRRNGLDSGDDVSDNDVGSSPGECEGRRTADTAATTGDESYPPLQRVRRCTHAQVSFRYCGGIVPHPRVRPVAGTHPPRASARTRGGRH